MKGRSNDYLWGQTDRLLSLICLPCSKKCCFVGLGWFCFAWLFPSGCIFFAFPGCWNVPWPRRQQGAESLPFPPWHISPPWYFGQDFIWLLKYVYIYINTISKLLRLASRICLFPSWSPGWEGEARWPEGIRGAQIPGLAAAQVQFDPR